MALSSFLEALGIVLEAPHRFLPATRPQPLVGMSFRRVVAMGEKKKAPRLAGT